MSPTGLIDGFLVHPDGHITLLDPEHVDLTALDVPTDGYVWLHFELHAASGFLPTSGLCSEFVTKALFAAETRPRLIVEHGGVLMNLRGINLNPDKNPEDMLSVRAFLQPNLLITLRKQKSLAIEAVRHAFREEKAPATAPLLLLEIINGLTDRIEPVIDRVADRIDDLELIVAKGEGQQVAEEVSQIRHDAMLYRRYLAPQREAVAKFAALGPQWLDEGSAGRAREEADRMLRVTEEVEITRDRAGVLNDQISAQRADKMNRNMMIISIMSAIFLPLGFLTGLLGMNVAGLPGTENPLAFALVLALCGVLGLGLLVYFRRLGWFGK